MMETGRAMQILDGLTSEDQRDEAGDSSAVEWATLIEAVRIRLDNAEYVFGDEEPAAIYALLAEIRNDADRIERDLLRQLKFGAEGMTWEEVAKAIDGEMASRQAMQKHWSRLTAPSRRSQGDMRRGAAAIRRTVAVDDTTTEARS